MKLGRFGPPSAAGRQLSAQSVRRRGATILDALGNIGDFVGGIGVVVTLAYLAVQIRQNTRQLAENAKLGRLAALDATAAAGHAVRSELASPEHAPLFLNGLADYTSLSRDERFRFRLLLQNVLGGLQALFVRYELEKLDPDTWRSQSALLVQISAQPGFQSVWPDLRNGYLPTFAAEIDRLRDSALAA